MIYDGALNAAIFLTFLRRLIKGVDRKLLLIVDNLRVHRAKVVTGWVAENTGRIELFYLPPYAPERNPDEYLNNDLKGNVHRSGLPNNKDELADRIHAFLLKLLELPGHVMSYFRHPCVQYAAAHDM